MLEYGRGRYVRKVRGRVGGRGRWLSMTGEVRMHTFNENLI